MKRNIILQAAVAAAFGSVLGAAHAGSVTAPAAAVLYAAEALTPATVITLPAITYTMGVARTAVQDFTLIYTPSAGSTFSAATCVPANFVIGGPAGPAATFSTKRASTTECAMDVDVTTAFVVGTTMTWSPAGLASHPLGVAGGNFTVTVALKDPGETSFVDNSGTVSKSIATSVNAINISATAKDTATTADVNGGSGPLLNFLANGAPPTNDTTTVAKAALTIDNNSVGAKLPDGTTNYDFKTGASGTFTINLVDTQTSFNALAAGTLCADLDGDAVLCEAGESFPGGGGSTRTLTTPLASTAGMAAVLAAPSTNPLIISFGADTVTSLGTGRTIAVTGTVNPTGFTAHAFADTTPGNNAAWWTWTANAIELWAPFFQTTGNIVPSFIFENTGALTVGYTAICLSEAGNAITANGTTTGSLTPGMTIINPTCTMTGSQRASIRFIINSPAGLIHAVARMVNSANGQIVLTPMERPYAGGTF